MDKIKLLAVLPYDGLRKLVAETVNQREDMEADCYTADMEDGAKLALELQNNGYFAIISRAGTAELISRISHLPVIDITITISDTLRAIRLAQNYSGKFAIVGFPMITKCAALICDMLQYQIHIFTIEQSNAIPPCLEQLKKEQYSLIVGDVITTNTAKRFGFNTILVTSGQESVDAALDQSSSWHKNFAKLRNGNIVHKKTLDHSSHAILVYSEKRELVYLNTTAQEHQLNNSEEFLKLLELPEQKRQLSFIKKINDTMWSISGKTFIGDSQAFTAFYAQTSLALHKSEFSGITRQDYLHIPTVNFDTFNTGNKAMRSLIDTAKKFGATSSSIVILGEKGTGKDSIAYLVYQNSPLASGTLLTIDCKWINEKSWHSLLNCPNSPFTDAGFTLYFKNLHYLSEEHQAALERYLHNTSIHKRNRLLFSYVPGNSERSEKGSLLQYIRNTLSALSLFIPPLNKRTEDIPLIASLYLNELNTSMGKQVIGLHPAAIRALQKFNWNHNVDQFKRVMKQLVTLTTTAYISEETTHNVLISEHYICATHLESPLNLQGSLDEITTNILQIIFQEENYNQSRTAKRLGISRSTLGRKLQFRKPN